jgi:hypothetical protein
MKLPGMPAAGSLVRQADSSPWPILVAMAHFGCHGSPWFAMAAHSIN